MTSNLVKQSYKDTAERAICCVDASLPISNQILKDNFSSTLTHKRLQQIIMKSLQLSFILFLICAWPQIGLSQTNIQLVTKKVEKTFTYRSGYEVNIEGQRAEVFVETWDKKEIWVQLEITAKHTDRAIAEQDVEKMEYQTEQVQNDIYLRNYLKTDEGTSKPQSKIKAKYLVKVPADCPVYLKNSFGIANVSNLINQLRINSQFSTIGLNNIKGQIDVISKFGDIEGQKLDGHMVINSRRSNISLSEITGRYDITAQYGILRIFADQNLLDLNIDAEKSEIFLFSPDPKIFAYDLEAKDSDVNLPSDMAFKFEDSQVTVQKASFKPDREYFANISIIVTLGEVTVEKKPIKN